MSADETPIHASHVKTHLRCQRRAAYDRRSPRTESPLGTPAGNGTAVHAVMQAAIESGARETPDRSDPIHLAATELSRWLPAPGAGFAEVSFCERVEGYLLGGTIDVVEPAFPRVTDWKTTSSLRWAVASLAVDPQAVLYSAAYESRFGEPPHLRWCYVEWNSYRVRAVEQAPMKKRLHVIRGSLDAILRNDAKEPRHIARDANACDAFGRRCDHYNTCWNDGP